MEKSIKNAKTLAIIGFIQIIPFTFLAAIGFMGILPPIVWALGMVLFVFYIRHAWGHIAESNKIRKLWIGSLVFNGIGLAIPVYTAFMIGMGILDIISRGSIRDDAWVLGAFMLLWSISIVTHVWLSYDGLRHLNAEEGISYSFDRLVSLPKFLNPNASSFND